MFLFGAETWVVTPHMGRVLGGFQYHVVRRLTGRLLRKRLDGEWEYTAAEATREEAGFKLMETYIWKRKNTVAQYIMTRPILELCKGTERKQGAWVGMRCWEWAGLDLEGAMEMAAAAEEEDGME